MIHRPRPFEQFKQHLQQQRWKIPCNRSTIYDKKHQEDMNGEICPYKHFLYRWGGLIDSEITLVSDSHCKLLQNIPHLEIQAVPGIDLARTLTQLTRQQLTSKGYRGFILHVGCNDHAQGITPYVTLQNIIAIVDYLEESTPSTRIAIGAILPRPVDYDLDLEMGEIKEENRMTLNRLLKTMCRERNILFANNNNTVMIDKTVDINMYKEDRLHLNHAGVAKLGTYYQGVAASLMETKGE